MKNKSNLDKYKGMSFAEVSEKIAAKYPDRNTNFHQKNAFEAELAQLAKSQQHQKIRDKAKQLLLEHRSDNVFGNGGPFGNNKTVINNMQPGQISYPNTWAMSPDILEKLPIPTTPNPYALVGPEAPFRGQTRTVSPDNLIGDISAYEVPGSDMFSTPKDAPKDTGSNAYLPAFIGEGLSLGLNAAILGGGYDKVNPIDNPYESDIKRTMGSRKIDTTAVQNKILSAFNASRSNLNNVRSTNVRQALEANAMFQTQKSLEDQALQEQQINLGLQADYAQTLGSLGQQKVQAQNIADETNARNKGNFQSQLSKMGAQIAGDSQFFTTKKLNEINNTVLADILNNKYSTFGISKEAVSRITSGKATDEDVIQLKSNIGEEATNTIIEKYK